MAKKFAQFFLRKNIKNINYSKLKIKNLQFKECKLEKLNFWESDIKNSFFEKTKIYKCVFTDADLSNSIFKNTEIKNTNFTHTILKGVNFGSSKFINVNFRDAIYDKHTVWPKKFLASKSGAIKEDYFNPYDYKYKLSIKTIKNLKFKNLQKSKKNYYIKKKYSNLEKKIITELTSGKGFIVIKDFYSKKKVDLAEKIINSKLRKNKNYKKISDTFEIDKRLKSINFFDIQNYNQVFVDMIQPKPIMNALESLMGKNFICTYYSCQNSLAESRGQNLHLDYPYVSYNKPGDIIPIGMGSNKYLLSCGVLTYLNKFDKDYAGPLILKNSHKFRRFPNFKDVKKNVFYKVKIPKGGILILNTLLWHAGLPNYSKNKDRNLIVAHYKPDFIKRRLNIAKLTKKKIIIKDKKNKGMLEQLLS